MGRVKAFEIDGLDLQFRTRDHGCHFHAIKAGEWAVMVEIRETTEKDLVAPRAEAWSRGKGPAGPQQKVLREKVVAHRAALLEQWSKEMSDERRRTSG